MESGVDNSNVVATTPRRAENSGEHKVDRSPDVPVVTTESSVDGEMSKVTGNSSEVIGDSGKAIGAEVEVQGAENSSSDEVKDTEHNADGESNNWANFQSSDSSANELTDAVSEVVIARPEDAGSVKENGAIDESGHVDDKSAETKSGEKVDERVVEIKHKTDNDKRPDQETKVEGQTPNSELLLSCSISLPFLSLALILK